MKYSDTISPSQSQDIAADFLRLRQHSGKVSHCCLFLNMWPWDGWLGSSLSRTRNNDDNDVFEEDIFISICSLSVGWLRGLYLSRVSSEVPLPAHAHCSRNTESLNVQRLNKLSIRMPKSCLMDTWTKMKISSLSESQVSEFDKSLDSWIYFYPRYVDFYLLCSVFVIQQMH